MNTGLHAVHRSAWGLHRSASGLSVQKLTTVSLNLVTILIIIWIFFDPFFRCLLLSEKCCHSLFIRLLTEPDTERKCIVKRFRWLNGKRIQTHRRPCCTPKPDADLSLCVDLPLDKKLWKIRTGPWAAGASRGRGPAFSKTLWLILNVSRETEIYSKGDYFKILHTYC